MGPVTCPDMSVNVAGLELKNPVLTASGTFGYGLEFKPFFDISRLGGIVTKGLSPAPRKGNPPVRICETPAGMLNAIGLQNIGVQAFIDDKLPALRRIDVAVVANIFGETIAEYVDVCERLDDVKGVHAIELNVSCPNTEAGGMIFGNDPTTLAEVVAPVRRATKLPLIVKLSPNVGDIRETARAAEAEGADSLSLVNTFVGMAVDVERRRPVLANISGGLSGPAIRPLAVWLTWQCSNAVNIPLIGMGGIHSADDALEFILAGASAIQVGTSNFLDPDGSSKLVDQLAGRISSIGASSVRELIGALQVGNEVRP